MQQNTNTLLFMNIAVIVVVFTVTAQMAELMEHLPLKP